MGMKHKVAENKAVRGDKCGQAQSPAKHEAGPVRRKSLYRSFFGIENLGLLVRTRQRSREA